MKLEDPLCATRAAPVAIHPNVALSPWVNERFPAWEELLSAHDVAHLTRRNRWAMARAVQTARTPRGEAIRGAMRRRGRGPVHWLSSLLACSECGSNYVQYGRTDYVCGGHHNGSNCRNGARFRMTDAESVVLAAITYDFASPAAIERAIDTAMAYYEREYAGDARSVPVRSAELANVDARERDVREQYKTGKLTPAVFSAWLAELEKERSSLTRPTPLKTRRVTRDEFASAYRAVVAKRLGVFTRRENAATAREGLRRLLASGRIVLRPNLERGQFEGTAAFDSSHFFYDNQLDIKMVAGERSLNIRLPLVA